MKELECVHLKPKIFLFGHSVTRSLGHCIALIFFLCPITLHATSQNRLSGQASSTLANTAPIILSIGVLMATTEGGAIEYNGTNLFYTNESNSRKTLTITGTDLPLAGGTMTGTITSRASTTIASTSPIKLPTGVLMATPEAGAIEFDGTSLYLTNASNSRSTIGSGGSSQWTTTASDIYYTTGKVGVGITAPTSNLHLPASTTIAKTAPIKIATGVLMATTEAGAIEFNGTSLFYTNESNTRKTLTITGTDLPLAGGTMTGTMTGRASTTIASTSPIKLPTGVLMATTEAGAIEFNGTSLFYTNESNTRKTLTITGTDLPLAGGTMTGTMTGRASTTIASTAPIKLPTGVLMATAEGGAIEYDGTNLYYTDEGNTRRKIAVYPKRATMWIDESTVTVGAANATVNDSSQIYGFYTYPSTSANGDTFTISFVLASGTYTFSILGITSTNYGKIDWYIDGVSVISAQDWYSSSVIYNVIKTASVTVSGDGYHTLKAVINGKNASSTSFNYVLTKVWLKPSSD